MAEIVNLRLARKARARKADAAAAATTRAKFGESRPARSLREAEAERAARAHDAARREDEA